MNEVKGGYETKMESQPTVDCGEDEMGVGSTWCTMVEVGGVASCVTGDFLTTQRVGIGAPVNVGGLGRALSLGSMMLLSLVEM